MNELITLLQLWFNTELELFRLPWVSKDHLIGWFKSYICRSPQLFHQRWYHTATDLLVASKPYFLTSNSKRFINLLYKLAYLLLIIDPFPQDFHFSSSSYFHTSLLVLTSPVQKKTAIFFFTKFRHLDKQNFWPKYEIHCCDNIFEY